MLLCPAEPPNVGRTLVSSRPVVRARLAITGGQAFPPTQAYECDAHCSWSIWRFMVSNCLLCCCCCAGAPSTTT